MNTELMQHRTYLTIQAPVALVMCVMGHVPVLVHVLVVAPSIFAFWLMFHSLVGFWKTFMIVYGFTFVSVTPVCFSLWLERMKWEQFEATRELDRERQVLQETQETLHCMLSSLWDASCTCHPDGTIASSTPHLEQLFGGGKGLVGSNLVDLVVEADGQAIDRLQDFLRNTVSAQGRQALSLQCSVRPHVLVLNESGTICDAQAF